MQITNQARNYAMKHGVHIYGLTSEWSRALVFYDIESVIKTITDNFHGVMLLAMMVLITLSTLRAVLWLSI